MEDVKCNWCSEKAVTAVPIRTNVLLEQPYQGETEYVKVEVVGACEEHKHKLEFKR